MPTARPLWVEQQLSPSAARVLGLLNELAGTSMTVMTVTPDRVRRAVEYVVARLTAAVNVQAEHDARERRTVTQVIEELEGLVG